MKRTIRILDCKRCNYTWPSTSEELPKVCPKCKSIYWEKDKTYTYGNTCYDAGKLTESINSYCMTNSTDAIPYRELTGIISSCKTNTSACMSSSMGGSSANTTMTETKTETKKKEEK